ncbi:MAG TPA: carbon storage regulator [Phycisphaerae bacterium]|nr:carbon storage regulator [Phycisphaerae bacterium]
MLVLTRRRDESIILTDLVSGERVTVIVTDIRADKVRLGIEAPDSVRVDRAEIDALRQAESKPRPLTAGKEDSA